MPRLRTLLTTTFLASEAVLGNVFEKVVDELKNFRDTTEQEQKTKNSEFDKQECQLNKKIKSLKTNIPIMEEKLAEEKMTKSAMIADTKKRSNEALAQDETAERLTNELNQKRSARLAKSKANGIEISELQTGVGQLEDAMTSLKKEPPTSLAQTSSRLGKHLSSAHLALIQTEMQTQGSGQVIQVLTKIQETFNQKIATISAEETKAQNLFLVYEESTNAEIKSNTDGSNENKKQIALNNGVLEGARISRWFEEGY